MRFQKILRELENKMISDEIYEIYISKKFNSLEEYPDHIICFLSDSLLVPYIEILSIYAFTH